MSGGGAEDRRTRPLAGAPAGRGPSLRRAAPVSTAESAAAEPRVAHR